MNNCSQDYNFIKFADYMIINIYMKGGMWPSRILLKITFVKLILILWYDTVSWFTMVLDLLTLLHTISFFATRTLLLCRHLWYSNFSLKIMTDWFIDWLESCFCVLLIFQRAYCIAVYFTGGTDVKLDFLYPKIYCWNYPCNYMWISNPVWTRNISMNKELILCCLFSLCEPLFSWGMWGNVWSEKQ